MAPDPEEDAQLRAVALRNANAIRLARERAESELLQAKEALERKTVELDHSLAVMRATLEATTDGILVTDIERRIIGCNENYRRLWRLDPGLPSQAQTHTELARFIAHQLADPGAFAARLDEIYASGAEAFDVIELLDGRIIERTSRIQYIEGRHVGRVWSFRDATEQRRAEQLLREEARILDLINRTGVAISGTLELPTVLQTVTDAGTELTAARFGAFFYNVGDEGSEDFRLYALSGAPRESFQKLGSPSTMGLFGPTFRGEGPVRIDDVLLDPRYAASAPHRGLTPGQSSVRSFLAVPVLSRSGQPIGGLFFGHPEPGVFSERSERLVLGIAAQAATAIDNARLYDEAKRTAAERANLIDAERAARAESERLSLLKDEFLATLSHELRTPLTAILGWARVLQLRPNEPTNVMRGIEAIVQNAHAQAQLIEDLLDMNRIVSGKLRLDVRPVDLSTIIDAAIESVRPSAEAKGLLVRKALDPLAGPVQGDPQRLQQIVWNLLSNAVKFTDKGGHIDVALQTTESQLQVAVKDSGIGIDPQFLPHVFERFRQADSSMTRQHGGLGLGLSIVKHLVELQGGNVRAESEGTNRGATFIVVLPLAPLRAGLYGGEQPRAAPALSADVSLAGLRVLVVDDQPDTSEMISRVLAESGAQVVTASSAAEAMGKLEAQQPDVLISDIGMPQTDGYQFIRDVRRLPPARGGHTPAIALTALARSEDRMRAMMAGYQVHIAKPIEPMELIVTVGSLANRTAAAQRAGTGRGMGGAEADG